MQPKLRTIDPSLPPLEYRTQGTAMTTPTDPFSSLHSFNKLLLNILSMGFMLGTICERVRRYSWENVCIKVSQYLPLGFSTHLPSFSMAWFFLTEETVWAPGPGISMVTSSSLLQPQQKVLLWLFGLFMHLWLLGRVTWFICTSQPPSGVPWLYHSSIGNHLPSFQCIKYICLASTSWSLLSCER